MSKEIVLDMTEFHNKFKVGVVNTDNIAIYDNICKSNGVILTLDTTRYTYWLDQFKIKYTIR